MTTLTDDFNRSPGAIGANYNQFPATSGWSINNGNAFHDETIAQFGSMIRNTPLTTDDMTVTATYIMESNPGWFVTTFARWATIGAGGDTDDYYFLDVNHTGDMIRLGRVFNGTGVYLQTLSNALGFSLSNLTVDVVLRVETISGNVQINAWVAGVNVVSNYVDSSGSKILTGKYFGIYCYGNGRCDFLKGEDFGGAAAAAQTITTDPATISFVPVTAAVTSPATASAAVNARMGTATPSLFKVGTQDVTAIYLGTSLVYSSTGGTGGGTPTPTAATHDLLGFHTLNQASDEFTSSAFTENYNLADGTVPSGWTILKNDASSSARILNSAFFFEPQGTIATSAIFATKSMAATRFQRVSGAFRLFGELAGTRDGVWLCATDDAAATVGGTLTVPSAGYKLSLETSTTVNILRRTGGVSTSVASAARTVTSSRQRYIFETFEAGSSITVRAKVWTEGTTEPAGWTMTYTDTAPLAAGKLALEARKEGGTGHSIEYDDTKLTTMPSSTRWHAKNFTQGYTGVVNDSWNQISVTEEGLDIRAIKVAGTWYSGWLSGNSTYNYLGPRYVEARVRTPTGNGPWSGAPWEWDSPYGARFIENDVNETLSFEQTKYHATVHAENNTTQVSIPVSTSSQVAGAWHVFAAAIYADHVDYYFDDVKVATATAASLGEWQFTTVGMVLNINLDMGGWGGTIDSALTEAHLTVDYVRVWTA